LIVRAPALAAQPRGPAQIGREIAVELAEQRDIARPIAAVESSRGNESPLPAVEAVFREAARALLPTDRDAAETLFTFAEVLGARSNYAARKARLAQEIAGG
jgi:hypothetical protein